MTIIPIKPLSANACWTRGRNTNRFFPTLAYKEYTKRLNELLPADLKIPKTEALAIIFVWGISNVLADYDNPTKPTQDIIAKFYGFNDKKIHQGKLTKIKVPKGKEFIAFEILGFDFNFDAPEFSEIKEYFKVNCICLPTKPLSFNF